MNWWLGYYILRLRAYSWLLPPNKEQLTPALSLISPGSGAGGEGSCFRCSPGYWEQRSPRGAQGGGGSASLTLTHPQETQGLL